MVAAVQALAVIPQRVMRQAGTTIANPQSDSKPRAKDAGVQEQAVCAALS